MVRNQQRKPGARKYRDFTDENLSRAVQEVKAQTLSLRKAAEKYGISPATLSRKIKGKHSLNVGRPCVISSVDEQIVRDGIVLASQWGFPLTTLDLRLIIKAYLDKRGVNETRFKNNMPGIEWVRGFLHRHQDVLSQRLCQNIKRARAHVNHKVIHNYFKELEDSLERVSPEAILNYDETNMTDDPGRVKIITRRGCKHPDRILDSSKASVSVMFCGSASGILLPPYVCYKAEHLYDSWTMGGPTGTRYNRSKNSWFNGPIFEDWFTTIVMPYFRRLPENSQKVLIGDNLASHISLKIVQECEQNNIRFVLLPANSTHLCQPLDVAFFRPLKGKWRATLNEWKSKYRGCVPKDKFPSLLKNCLDSLNADNASSKNLISGFRATGIHPINAEEVLKRLPPDTEDQDERSRGWYNTFKTFLQESRITETTATVKQRKRRINVTPGKSISSEDLAANEDADTNERTKRTRGKYVSQKHLPKNKCSSDQESGEPNQDDPRPSTSSCAPSKRKMSKRYEHLSDSDSELSSDNFSVHDESDNLFVSSDSNDDDSIELSINDFKTDDFVLVKLVYDEKMRKKVDKTFVAQILSINDISQELQLKFMRKSTKANNIYIFPTVNDISFVKLHKIQRKLSPIFCKRGRYCFSVETDF